MSHSRPLPKILQRYKMGNDQCAQLDCRFINCVWHQDGECKNESPAITLNENGSAVCWSKVEVVKAENAARDAMQDWHDGRYITAYGRKDDEEKK